MVCHSFEIINISFQEELWIPRVDDDIPEFMKIASDSRSAMSKHIKSLVSYTSGPSIYINTVQCSRTL